MKARLALVIFTLCLALGGWAKGVKTVEGSAVFYVPSNMTLEQAKEEAIRRAKIDALNQGFGNTIGVSNTTVSTESDERFYSNGFDLVRGEWIETIGEPEIKKAFDGDDIFITCKIKGKAREKKTADTALSVKMLRNGVGDDCEASEFVCGNKMYLSFASPVNGYVSVYQYDPVSNLVYCLLPYRKDATGSVPVEHDKRYVFFSKASSDNPRMVDEYRLGCEADGETNTIYVLFSPNQFTKTLAGNDDKQTPRNLPFDEFNAWKARCQAADPQFQVVQKNIIIRK